MASQPPITRALSDASVSTKAARRTADSREAITWANIRRAWPAYVLLSPIFLMLLLFVYYPPVLGLIRAFYEWMPLKKAVFIGFENFRTYFEAPETMREFANVGRFLYFGLLSGVIVPFAMAEMIFAVRWAAGKEIYRLAIVLPMLVPSVVYTLLWRHIYDPEFGPINIFLKAVGLDVLARNWLGDPAIAIYAILGVGFPWVAGIGTLVCLGGLAQISESVFDACLLDGCIGLRRVFLVDAPLMLGQLRMLIILSVIGAITSFQNVMILTQGGPGYSTFVPGLRMYDRAFTHGQFGYGSAIGLLLFIASLVLTILINRFVRPYSEQLGG